MAVYTGTTDSREGFTGLATRREEKREVVRYVEAVGARGVYRGLGYNTGAN
jgi:hypothetical protein